ncbi:MAG: hypothetical protein ACW98F_12620 [Candidatus Hodarchaeales archaeon]
MAAQLLEILIATFLAFSIQLIIVITGYIKHFYYTTYGIAFITSALLYRFLEYLLSTQILLISYYTYLFLGILCLGYARYLGVRLEPIETCNECNFFEKCQCGCNYGLCKNSTRVKNFTQTKTISCEGFEPNR